MSQQAHFARLAASYDRLRPVPAETPLGDALVAEGRLAGKHVLDIGCGTGSGMVTLAERHGCRVTGVDPSAEMLAQARSKLPDADLRLATAEELPFPDGSFEGATMVSVIHHVDASRALPQARRVLVDGARFASADMHPDGFAAWWAARFFPSLVELERERFPRPETLLCQLDAAGFSSAWWLPLPTPRRFTREEGLARLRGRAYSTLDRLTDEELQAGLERAERDLPDVVEYVLEWALVTGEA
jgi:ubiquinone/menaquinone biosynthesis C-methylase UbiE